MRYGSVCSGIEAATAAWHPLGWQPAFFSEIEKFPSAVLAHRYGSNMPGDELARNGVPNLGDMTKFQEWPDYAIDLLVGGTPCQSFSVAGLRQGLKDPRGNLMLTYLAIAKRYRPTWVVWENVPGVLSSNGGRDFGTFLRGLEECGYHAAWRVLDAQFVRVDGFARAVPQRRRRVFVVGYLGDWRRAASVLFESESLRGHPSPSRKPGKGFAADVVASLTASGRGVERTGETRGQDPVVARPLLAGGNGINPLDENLIVMAHGQGGAEITHNHSPTLTTLHEAPILAFDTTQITSPDNRSNPQPGGPSHPLTRGGDAPAIAFQTRFVRNGRGAPDTVAAALTSEAGSTGKGDSAQIVVQPHAFDMRQSDIVQYGDITGPLDTLGNSIGLQTGWDVRRLTPRECERLQGFGDDFTLIPWRGGMSADGPRYKALGNSMAVNVMRWIGQSIERVESLEW